MVHSLLPEVASVSILTLLALLPTCLGQAGQVRTVGHSGVSAQMAFLAGPDHVMFMDKAENNPISINNHPAWVARYSLSSNTRQAMDVRTNTFCAGGAPAGDGRYVVTGGNAALGYQSADGGFALNIYDPATNTWEQNSRGMQKNRWYSSVEPMADGSVIIVGGMSGGGFVSVHSLNEPTYEFYPSKGRAVYMDILRRTVPLNLFPLIFLMANGELFVQSNRQAIMWNLNTATETRLQNIPDVPRPYPANAGVAMLPMAAANNYRQTILFCGGISLGTAAAWGDLNGPAVRTTDRVASTSCQQITPLSSREWSASDPLPEPRTMGMFIHLPDGTLFFGGGAKKGTAGYTASGGGAGRPVGQSLGDDPSYTPLIFNPRAPAGRKWRSYGRMQNPRLYHSSAVLLPDGAVLMSGSNPNEDVTNTHWPTSYSVDKWYPPWYDARRPSGSQLPSRFRYGGESISIDLTRAAASMGISNIESAYIRLVRTGFSTHAVNWGQRSIRLGGRVSSDKSRLTATPIPNNPNLFAPGPALAFLVVNDIPSQGKLVHVGPKSIPTGPSGRVRLAQASEDLPEERKKVAASSQGEGGGSEPENESAIRRDVDGI